MICKYAGRTSCDHPLKVPHRRWNELFQKPVGTDSHVSFQQPVGTDPRVCPLFEGLPKDFYLYFVHSFHAVCDDQYAIGKTHYGYEFVSAVQNGNIYGIQPHPEKSHENGTFFH